MSTGRLNLGDPVTDGAPLWVNFFNRRLLTGDDLTREQDAERRALARLTRAVGAGVAGGLGVWRAATQPASGAPIVVVDAGLAITSDGQALELPRRVEVQLAASAEAAPVGRDTGFADCLPREQGGQAPDAAGVYILSIAPAREGTGRAPIGGLDDGVAPCAVGYWADGVRLRLVRINLGQVDARLGGLVRSAFTHLMLGTEDVRRVGAFVGWPPAPATRSGDAAAPNPFQDARDDWGLRDDLSAVCFPAGEVPLAALAWTGQGLEWVDTWSVRRRLIAPTTPGTYAWVTGDRLRAEAEARLHQFHDQVHEDAPRTSTDPGQTAAERFVYLPPVCVVPLRVSDTDPAGGYDLRAFLGPQSPARLAVIDARDVPALIEEGMSHAPVRVGTRERVRAYLVRENLEWVRQGLAGAGGRQLVAVLAGPGLPYRGRERFAGPLPGPGAAVFGPGRFATQVD